MSPRWTVTAVVLALVGSFVLLRVVEGLGGAPQQPDEASVGGAAVPTDPVAPARVAASSAAPPDPVPGADVPTSHGPAPHSASAGVGVTMTPQNEGSGRVGELAPLPRPRPPLDLTQPEIAAAPSIEPIRLLPGAIGAERYTLMAFDNSPFPYAGLIPDTAAPFLDIVSPDGRRGHTSPRGGLYWEDERYSDNRSVLFVPSDFDLARPAVLVVFFHGNQSILERDVMGRQRVGAQLAASGLNAVLLAPQFAVDALDSSAGRFWQPGAFAAYLHEASLKFAELYGDPPGAAALFEQMPTVLVAYSGAYLPAAYAVSVGGADERLCGVILLDALYGEEGRFADWISGAGSERFFFSAYSASSAPWNNALQRLLSEDGVPFGRSEGQDLLLAGVNFLEVAGPVDHNSFVTFAWRDDPLQWLLAQISTQGGCAVN